MEKDIIEQSQGTPKTAKTTIQNTSQSSSQPKEETFTIDNLIANLESNKQNLTVETTSNQAKIEVIKGEGLIKSIANLKNIQNSEAFLGIAIICQKGGTSKRAQGDIYAVINSKKLTLTEVRETIKNNEYKFTLRQWARTYATQIYKACSLFGIDGDLAKILTRKDDSISAEDAIWCSNFQMDNLDCPENIRGHIKNHFSELFPKNKQ